MLGNDFNEVPSIKVNAIGQYSLLEVLGQGTYGK
jgi:hypothetical protein